MRVRHIRFAPVSVRRIRCVSVVLLALVAVACSSPETGWTSRTVGDVVFDHPRAWAVFEGEDTRIQDALVEVVDQDNNGVAVYRYRNTADGLDALTETFEGELEAVDGQMVTSGPADVHGAPEAVLLQAELEYEEGDGSRPYRLTRLLIERDDVIVEIRGREPVAGSDRTVQRVLDSVRVPD